MIVMNDVSRSDIGFDVDTNEVTLVTADGEQHCQPALEAGMCLCNLGCARAIQKHGCGRITDDTFQEGRIVDAPEVNRRGLGGGDHSRR